MRAAASSASPCCQALPSPSTVLCIVVSACLRVSASASTYACDGNMNPTSPFLHVSPSASTRTVPELFAQAWNRLSEATYPRTAAAAPAAPRLKLMTPTTMDRVARGRRIRASESERRRRSTQEGPRDAGQVRREVPQILVRRRQWTDLLPLGGAEQRGRHPGPPRSARARPRRDQ